MYAGLFDESCEDTADKHGEREQQPANVEFVPVAQRSERLVTADDARET